MSMADRAREKAETAGQRSFGYMKLPQGVNLFQPNKDTLEAKLAIIPFEVTKNNIDGVEIGESWYRVGYYVHRGVGVNSETVICRTSEPSGLARIVASRRWTTGVGVAGWQTRCRRGAANAGVGAVVVMARFY